VSNGGLDPNGNVVGPADQRSQIKTFNIAPTWTRLINPTAFLPWAALSGGTGTITIPAPIRSQTSGRPAFRAKR
jgi:hypothetical protein